MRNISAKRRTTPTYIYNISDAQASGIDLERMQIGMTIVFGNGNSKFEPTVYVLAKNETNDIFEVPGEDPNNGIVHFIDSAYCQHTTNSNSFSVTLPLWKLHPSVISEATFQTFLYGSVLRAGGGTIVDDDGVDVPMVSLVTLHNIVIDEGLFTLEESLVPPIVGQSKRNENYVEFV